MRIPTASLAALLASTLLAACGGAASDAAPVALADDAAPVRIEGCAVDAAGPAPALPVTARDATGRVLASALTDADGRWRMHVPPRQVLHFAPETPGADGLTLLTGQSATTLGACLRARS